MPDATTFATERSFRWSVSEQSSTERSTPTSPGKARSTSDDAGEARRAGDAAEAEDGDPLHVRPHPQAVHEPGVERRRGEPGDGHEVEVVHVAGAEARGRERPGDRVGAQVEGHPDPGVVRLLEGVERRVLGERQGEEPPTHPDGPVQLVEALRVEVLLRPVLPQCTEDGLLVRVVGRERPAHGAQEGPLRGGRGGRRSVGHGWKLTQLLPRRSPGAGEPVRKRACGRAFPRPGRAAEDP